MKFNTLKIFLVCSFIAGVGFIVQNTYALWPRYQSLNLHSSTPIERSSLGIPKKRILIQKVTVAGTVVPARKTVITAPYNGYVSKIYGKIGQKVSPNEPVVSLVESLRSKSDNSFPLRAPFSGIIVQILKTEGEYVESGKDTSGLVRIDDLSKMYTVANVPESDIDKVKIGQDVELKIAAVPLRTYKGKVTEIAKAAQEPATSKTNERVEFTAKIQILDPDDSVKSGMTAILDILTLSKKDTLCIEHEYVQTEKDKFFVVLSNGEKRRVMIGIQTDEYLEILEGLSENDQVRRVDFLALGDK